MTDLHDLSGDLSSDEGLRSAWAAHADELFGHALRALGDRESAEEAVQETFVRAWRSARRYDPSRPLRPWLYAILRHVVVDQHRARAARPPARSADPGRAEGTEPVVLGVDARIDDWIVDEALDRISDRYRVILVETYVKGRPYAEVAAELGIPVGTARSRSFYGLKALRVALDELGWEP